MRFRAKKPLRRVCWTGGLVLCALTGLSVYVIATRDPISIHGFQQLRST